MNLREKQAEFLTMVSKLVSFCAITNKKVFINELYRTKEIMKDLRKTQKEESRQDSVCKKLF
ncbi:MAG TPA: hypothetical protein P5140_05525 [Methanofastidiosum sp.]|nr:hypothetical protein [Methanofastidiosum sp.]